MDDDEEVLQRYGTPLEPLDEDEIPSKKPISIEDQIVTDENGKRRFHGAFTGGFSAGFWNTVGSLEGWKPSEFKSSRSEKAPQRLQQKPEDFMDDEDLGEFGIAPQRIQAQSDFQIETTSNSRKRKLVQSHGTDGPIPGVPVLAELLRPVEDKIAVRILKSMGWRPGQGIGPRLTSKQKKRTSERNKREEYVLRHYGEQENEENYNKASAGISDNEGSVDSHEDDDDDNGDLTFAPDDYDTLVCASKTNRFGLGYTGLSHDTSENSKPAHFNLFGPLEVVDKNNKKLSIRGQAFGVGALEEEDEDIYAHDDLSKYDFSLEERKKKPKAPKPVQDRHIVEGFAAAKHDVQYQKPYIVEPPAGYQPRNWAVRKSRFAPLDPEKAQEIEASTAYKKAGLGRHDLNPNQRSAILEEQSKAKTISKDSVEKRSMEELQEAQRKRNERTKSLLERISARSSDFTRGGLISTTGEEVQTGDKEMTEVKEAVEQEKKNLLALASNKTKGLGATPKDNSKFKPFLANEAKQLRYEKFLEANLQNETEIDEFLATIQPIELSAWDRAMERQEFIQARKIYKPLGGTMSDRFVSEAALSTEKPSEETNKDQDKLKDAKKIVVERTKEMWKPQSLLCKRFNIAEPYGGNLDDSDFNPVRKSKLSIFDYLETSVNRKDNFHTPVIIPKHMEQPKAVVSNRTYDEAPKKIQKIDIEKKTQPLSSAPPTPSISTPSIDSKPFKVPPKTELEKRVEECLDKPPSEKVELFRAIFEDSDDDVEEQPTQSTEKPKLEIDKLDLHITKPVSTTAPSDASAKLLRHSSPPKGIFSALFTSKNSNGKESPLSTPAMGSILPNELQRRKTASTSTSELPAKITFKKRSERQQPTEDTESDAYGPKLPAHLGPTAKPAMTSTTAVESRLITLLEKHKSSDVLQDTWVERTHDGSDDSVSDSSSESSSNSSGAIKRHKKKSKKSKKSADKVHEKKKSKKLKKKSKTKKKSKKKKSK